jgi:hypothetical protein
MSPLARDVTVVLALKAVVLLLLWFAFFRTPAAPHMTMDPQEVEYRVLAPSPAPEAPEPLNKSRAIATGSFPDAVR